jgi:hypothetical protein
VPLKAAEAAAAALPAEAATAASPAEAATAEASTIIFLSLGYSICIRPFYLLQTFDSLPAC